MRLKYCKCKKWGVTGHFGFKVVHLKFVEINKLIVYLLLKVKTSIF